MSAVSVAADPVDIAVVGIACRFPGGADGPEAFWRLLEHGFDAVADPPPSRTAFLQAFDPDPKTPGTTYTRRGGFLDRVDLFDAQFFGISPREAAHIDPQHRLLLELAWEACEDAGASPHALAGTNTGVFIGISTHDYGDIQMYPAHRRDIDMHTNVGTATSIAANRISYALDLRGPSVAIDTACSSSLSAVHFACQSLRAGECQVAIVGGAQILLAPELTIGFAKASMLSRDGACRAFAAGANGYVRAEGAGVVVLTPMADARRRGDAIWAVIKATAVNQDGRTPGITVPSPAAQQSMIETALARAGIAPSAVDYVEAHGTGTPVGDPIEARAIAAALAPGRNGRPCAIGSVKTNLGHLEAASGIAGLIKVALALRHRRIPPSLHFAQPSDAIDLAALGLRMVTALEDWPRSDSPPTAGVNSFGFGGANAHVVLQAPPDTVMAAHEPGTGPWLLPLSARSEPALAALAAAYAERLRAGSAPALSDVCYTAAERRAHHDHRLAVVAASSDECAALLGDARRGATRAGIASGRVAAGGPPKIAFVFSGMGPQWWGMGRELTAGAPVFRQALERCDELLRPYAGWSLLEELAAAEPHSRVADPQLAQVTNFAIQFALVELWASYGIRPAVVIGHSGGAMAAACVAGIHPLEDSLFLSYHRSRLQGRPENAGRMLAVGAPLSEIASLLDGHEERVTLAAVNAPSSITLAGDGAILERIAATLLERQVFARLLPVTIAYHSPAMDAIGHEFRTVMQGLRGRPAVLPFVSDLTGGLAAGPNCDADYWWRAIRQPVRFSEGLACVLDQGATVIVEISPHPVLGPSIRECLKACGRSGLVLPSLSRQEGERTVMLRSLGALYAAGCQPDWRGLREEGASCVKLPRYPWQRERHWFEPSAPSVLTEQSRRIDDDSHPLLAQRVRAARPTWDATLGLGDTAYLREHVVQGSPLCPGATYVEQALAAQAAIDATLPIAVSDLEFLKPLRIDAAAGTPVQLVLDQSDGRFEVFSTGAGDRDVWVSHARGRVRAARDTRRPVLSFGDVDRRCERIVPVQDFYAAMAHRGLEYGASFRSVRSLHTGEGEAVASIAADGIESGRHLIHPALLDAAFQVLVAAAGSDGRDAAAAPRLFLPISVAEVRLHRRPGAMFRVAAAVVDSSDAAVSGNLTIVDGEGQLSVEVVGLTARLFVAGASRGDDDVDRWLYEYRWECDATVDDGATERLGPLPAAALAPAFDLAALARINERAAEEARSSRWRDYDDGVEQRLDEIAAAYVSEAFAQLGCEMTCDASLDVPVAGAGGAREWRERLRQQLCLILERGGLARQAAGGWQSTGDRPRATAARLCKQLADEYPRHHLDIALLGRCGPRIADVLTGRAEGRDVLFEGDGFALLKRFYRESPASAFYNALTATVVAGLATAPGARPVRVLEVGAGTGGTSSYVLPRLPAGQYVFSDASPLFLERARTEFSDRADCSYRLFDVTRDPMEQGLEPRSFDLILAANALHAVAEVEPAMRALTALLAPGGALVLLEITRHPAWLDIAFGLMDTWWTTRDRARRPAHPLMPGHEWQRLMHDCGLESATIIADTVDREPAQSVVVGRRSQASPAADTAAEAPLWIVLSDQHRGVGRRLTSLLAEAGLRTITVDRAADLRASTAVDEASNAAGIIHLCSLDAPEIGDVTTIDQATTMGCASVLDLLQGIVGGPPLAERTLFLVTAGAQVVPQAGDREPDLQQAPLWGFGRVVRKEWPTLHCRLVDVSRVATDDELRGLASEIAASSAASGALREEELAFRGGGRFVHRLQPTSRGRLADAVPAAVPGVEDGWRAELPSVGALDRIVFRRCGRPAPVRQQVEVRIDAASLNFRDVVVAMGAVSGLEQDRTFGGRRLGFDLAGVVTKCGQDVAHVQPGDAVMGIAPGAFASFALTDAELIVARPASLTAAEAATLPVAYVTAWYALQRLAQLRAGESILIHAASGGVGIAAIQMAKRAGARIFATAGSDTKRAFVRSLGVSDVMDSRSLSFAEEVRELSGGRGVDVVLNSLAGEALEHGLSTLAPYGRFIELGKADIYGNQRLGLGPFRRNLSFFAVDLDRMCFERTAFIGELLREVAGEFAAGRLQPPPYTTFPMAQLTEAMRFMAQARHIGKIVVRNDQAEVRVRSAVPDRVGVRGDGSYLITGGLGGVGLATARWLLDRGAGAVALMGRRPPATEVEATIAAWRLAGARVEVLQGDTSRAVDVARVMAAIARELPPLRGIVHAAMALDDRPLMALDRASLDVAMAPKAHGAWNLHQQSLGSPLDFFVSFSSITAMLGNPQQANYAAANAFLDALAGYRRARDLPATTISWGVINGAGYVARHPEIEAYLNRQGYLSFSTEQAFHAMSELLRHDAAHVMAARIDWGRFGDYAPGPAASPQIRHLIPAADHAGAAVAEGLRACLERDEEPARVQRLSQYLREQVARLLGAAPQTIDVDRSIMEFGLDSLIAVELTVILERDLGVEIPGTRILAVGSVRALTTEVLAAMKLPAVAPPSVLEPQGAAAAVASSEVPHLAPSAGPASEPADDSGSTAVPARGGTAASARSGDGRVDYRSLDYSRWSPGQRAIRRFAAAGFALLGRIETRGLEHIPTEGPCLLVVNHLSMADVPLMLTLLPRRAIILAVDELARFRILDWFVSDMGQAIYITRNQHEEEPLRQALAVLEAGGLLAVAPEGTRNRSGLGPARSGAAYLASEAQVPIVPIVAWGQERWRERLRRFGRIPIHVRAGEPLRLPPGPAAPPELRRYTIEIMNRLAALLPPQYRGAYPGGAEADGVAAGDLESPEWTSRS